MNIIKVIKDCLRRLYALKRRLDDYENDYSVNIEIPINDSNYRHPILDMDEEEKKIFIQCFGEPFNIKHEIAVSQPEFYREFLEKRIKDYRMCAGMLNSKEERFLGEKNFLEKESGKRRYMTGRLIK